MDLADKWEHAQRSYGGKVRTFARNARGRIRDYEQNDIEQELLIVLWECVRTYDPDRGGASFNTFFQRSAKNRVITLMRAASTKSRTAVLMSMTDEAVQSAVEDILTAPAAERAAIARLEVAELVAEWGEEVLDGRYARQLRAAVA